MSFHQSINNYEDNINYIKKIINLHNSKFTLNKNILLKILSYYEKNINNNKITFSIPYDGNIYSNMYLKIKLPQISETCNKNLKIEEA